MGNTLFHYFLISELSVEQRLRKQLLRDIYYRLPLVGDTINELNEFYRYTLSPGAYQLMLLRVFPTENPDTPVPLNILLNVEKKMRCDLSQLFCELETIILEDRVLCFFNITTHRDSPATDQFKLSIGRFFAELSTSDSFDGYAFVMSEGTPAESVADLDQCFQSAISAMEYGAVYGLNQRYDSYEQIQTLGDIMSILTVGKKSQLRQLVETLNMDEIQVFVEDLFHDSYAQVVNTPALAYQLPHRLLDLTADAVADYYLNHETCSALLGLWHQRIDDCLNLEKLQRLTMAGIQELCEQYRKQLTVGRSPSILKAKAYINAHFREKLNLNTIAEHVHLNHQYLSALFKRETGLNISEYITEVRLEHARFLLRSTTDSIQSIAESAGYQDPQYFSRRFRQTMGLSPYAYRSHSKTTSI